MAEVIRIGINDKYKNVTRNAISQLLQESSSEVRIVMNAKNFTISQVPHRFGKRRLQYYEPSVVAIGPYHRKKTHLNAMEEHKWWHLNSFIKRIPGEEETQEVGILNCIKMLNGFKTDARMLYFEKMEMKDEKLVEMLLLDGCFIVETILLWYDHKDMISYSSWFSRQIWEDLLLFENQIPFFILENLYKFVQTDKNVTFIHIAQNYIQDRTVPLEMKTTEEMEMEREIEMELELRLETRIAKDMDARVEKEKKMKMEMGTKIESASDSGKEIVREEQRWLENKPKELEMEHRMWLAPEMEKTELEKKRREERKDRRERKIKMEMQREEKRKTWREDGMSMEIITEMERKMESEMEKEDKIEKILKRVVVTSNNTTHLLQLYYHSTVSKQVNSERTEASIVNQKIYSLRWLYPLRLLFPVIAYTKSFLADRNYPKIQTAVKVPSATKLKDAGVKFKARISNNFMDITFDEGVLEIPPITLDSQRKCRMMNLIAFEQSNQGSYDLTSYAEFMDNIIDTKGDVEILQEAGIIVSYLKDNHEVALFFNQLSEDKAISNEHMLTPVMQKIKKYAEVDWHRWRAYLHRHYFTNPWTIISLIAAFILLALTVLQTAYTMQAYYHPPL